MTVAPELRPPTYRFRSAVVFWTAVFFLCAGCDRCTGPQVNFADYDPTKAKHRLMEGAKGLAPACEDDGAKRVIDAAGRANAEGVAAMKRRDWAAAERAFRDALTLVPDYPDARFNAGVVALERGDADAAIRAFVDVLRVLPEWSDPRAALGRALLKAGRREQALEAYAQALRDAPDDTSVRASVARLWGEDGKVDLAGRLIEEGRKTDPDDAMLLEAEIEILTNAGRVQALEALIDRLAAASAVEPRLLQRAARSLALAGRPQQALTLIEAKSATGNAADWHDVQGLTLAALNRHAEALPHVEAAVAALPDDPDRRILLAFCYAELGRFDDADPQLVRVRPKRPDDPQVLLLTAMVDDGKGRIAAARAGYERFLARTGTLPDAHPVRHHVADVERRLDQLAEPNPPSLAEVRAMIRAQGDGLRDPPKRGSSPRRP